MLEIKLSCVKEVKTRADMPRKMYSQKLYVKRSENMKEIVIDKCINNEAILDAHSKIICVSACVRVRVCNCKCMCLCVCVCVCMRACALLGLFGTYNC